MLCPQLLAEGCLGRRVMQQGLQAQAGHRPQLCLATRSRMATSWWLPGCPPTPVQVYLSPHPTCAFFQKKSKFTRAKAPWLLHTSLTSTAPSAMMERTQFSPAETQLGVTVPVVLGKDCSALSCGWLRAGCLKKGRTSGLM